VLNRLNADLKVLDLYRVSMEIDLYELGSFVTQRSFLEGLAESLAVSGNHSRRHTVHPLLS
jgi:hypothetical protein